MSRFGYLLVLSFIGSLASILSSRGVYFYTKEQFQFGFAENLWLAVGGGVTYFLGAMPSHRLAHPLGERRLIAITLILQTVVMSLTFARPTATFVVAGQLLFQFFNGMMWPVVESYVGAGRSAAGTNRALGQFNFTWASTVPLGLIVTGLITDRSPAWLFGVSAILLGATLLPTLLLAARPPHIGQDHPDRPPAADLARYRALLASSRWLLLLAYALLFLLTPLTPILFTRLGYTNTQSAAIGSTFDFIRLFTFLALGVYVGWRSRAAMQWLAILLMPASFIAIMLGAMVFESTTMIVLSLAVFGFSAGLAYYAALYYAMVVKNSSVDAGGAHEAFIGLGYTLGPAVGLVGHYIGAATSIDYTAGVIGGIVVLILACCVGAVLPLAKLRKEQSDER